MTSPGDVKVIESLREIPDFASEDEEAEFWATHQVSDTLVERLGSVPRDVLPGRRPGSRTVPVAIRFDATTLQRLRVLADRRHKGYQTLLKEFVIERLYEEERREGLVRANPARRR